MAQKPFFLVLVPAWWLTEAPFIGLMSWMLKNIWDTGQGSCHCLCKVHIRTVKAEACAPSAGSAECYHGGVSSSANLRCSLRSKTGCFQVPFVEMWHGVKKGPKCDLTIVILSESSMELMLLMLPTFNEQECNWFPVINVIIRQIHPYYTVLKNTDLPKLEKKNPSFPRGSII